MAEQVASIKDAQREARDTIDQVKSDVDELLDEISLEKLSGRMEEFGRSNPLLLAIAAMGVGLAAGLLMSRGRYE